MTAAPPSGYPRACMFRRIVCFSSLLLLAAAASAQLNVLLITADDLGLQLSSYGETLIETPELDALAASGVQFEVAYVAQASCSPSRSAIFTGLFPHANGQYGLTNTGYALHERLHDQTIPALLKKAGYRTGIIGKLHVAPEETFPFDFRPRVNTRIVRDVAEQARTFLRAEDDAPFFLMVNYSDPHAYRVQSEGVPWHFPRQIDGLPADPIDPGPKTLFSFQRLDTPEQRERTANYHNTVMRLDAGVGMLLDALEDAGREPETLVIFVSDHGPPFARGKTTVYESGLRVPFLVRWPGVSRPMKSPAMVSTVDILPTILDAAGEALLAQAHGKSLRPALSDPDAAWRQYLAGEFHYHGVRPFYPRRAIRDRRWKLIHNLRAADEKPSTGIDGDPAYRASQTAAFAEAPARQAFDTFANPPEYELYDLENDPDEFENLAGQWDYAAIQSRLTMALRQWRWRTDDPFLDPQFVKRMAAEGPPALRGESGPN